MEIIKTLELKLLERAQEILSTPEKWTTGYTARNASGEEVPPDSEEATCWCTYGAIAKAVRESKRDMLMVGAYYDACTLLEQIIDHEFGSDLTIAEFNDTKGYDAVKELLSKGVAILREENETNE